METFLLIFVPKIDLEKLSSLGLGVAAAIHKTENNGLIYL